MNFGRLKAKSLNSKYASGPLKWPVDQALDRLMGSLRIAWKDGEVRPTHRKPITGPRSWQTRADPFENSWATIELWLNEQ
ncbi:MAG: hypothetical protein M3Z23_02195, partial [Acidobacteriota bacterium]|nr:hypothetical protein [Acidobacteriota bacterium]